MSKTAMRVIELHEREARIFPYADLFDSQGRSLVLPETRALSAVDLRDVLDGIQLRALGLVGYLPLTQDLVLNLRPKFPTTNLWQMLDVSDEAFNRILPVLRGYDYANQSPPHYLLVRGFCHYLKKALSDGLARAFYREAYEGYFKPRIEFGKTLARYLSRGDGVRTASNIFSFSANFPCNSVLKAACLSFLKVVPKSKGWAQERALLISALDALQAVRVRQWRSGSLDLTDGLPQRIRDSYRGALTVFSILAGDRAVGFPYSARGSEMPSFLLNLDEVFERFVRNIFRVRLHSRDVSVTDGNDVRHQRPLFTDNQRYPVKPDIIFRRGSIAALGEVKYKPKIEESDRYQLISHVMAMGSPNGVFISPALSSEEAGAEYVGSIGGIAKLYHYRLNVGSELDAACDEMVLWLEALIAAAPPRQSPPRESHMQNISWS